jgi:CBS-domain-containing membrane protein
LAAVLPARDAEGGQVADATKIMSELMGQAQIRRIPVIHVDRQLVGRVSPGDLSTEHAPGAAETLEEVSPPPRPTIVAKKG